MKEPETPCPSSYNRFSTLSSINDNKTIFDTFIENHKEKVLCYTTKPLREIKLKVGLEKPNSHEGFEAEALLDSGATGLFINKSFAKKHGLCLSELD